jgi:hypothetical protein
MISFLRKEASPRGHAKNPQNILRFNGIGQMLLREIEPDPEVAMTTKTVV